MNPPLHHGKLTEEVKTTVTESMHDLLADKARQAKCNPSDLFRDALWLVLTGATYLDHVANDRRSVMQSQWREQGDKSDNENNVTVLANAQTGKKA